MCLPLQLDSKYISSTKNLDPFFQELYGTREQKERNVRGLNYLECLQLLLQLVEDKFLSTKLNFYIS